MIFKTAPSRLGTRMKSKMAPPPGGTIRRVTWKRAISWQAAFRHRRGRVEANGFFGTRVVPRAGASYALRSGSGFWGATRLRASYGEGIKEPTILPMDCSPQLKPEQSVTVDAGIDQYFASDRLHLSVTFFHSDFRDIVSFTSSGPQNCPAFDGSYFNTDKARAAGVNSSFELKAARWLSIAGNYSYDDSKVLDAPTPSIPRWLPVTAYSSDRCTPPT